MAITFTKHTPNYDDMQFGYSKLFEYRMTFCMLFAIWLELIQESYVSVHVHVHISYTVQGTFFYWRIYLSQYSIFVCIKALFPKLKDCMSYPLITIDIEVESFSKPSNLNSQPLLHSLTETGLIQLISEQTF